MNITDKRVFAIISSLVIFGYIMGGLVNSIGDISEVHTYTYELPLTGGIFMVIIWLLGYNSKS